MRSFHWLVLVSAVTQGAPPGSVAAGVPDSQQLPWCSNGTHLTAAGRWGATSHAWEISPPSLGASLSANSVRGGGRNGGDAVHNHHQSCALATHTGLAALEALRGTRFVFLGDSVLRQVFHGVIHGTFRQMPVIIDPVYGWAHYTAALPDIHKSEDNKERLTKPSGSNAPGARDVLVARNKDFGRNHGFDSIAAMGTSTLEGWDASSGVEAVYSFQNSCEQVLAWLHQWKGVEAKRAANSAAARTAAAAPASWAYVHGAPLNSYAGGFRQRIVLITNLGASNIKGNAAVNACLSKDLPAATKALALLWQAPTHPASFSPPRALSRDGDRLPHLPRFPFPPLSHRIIVVNQPVKYSALEGRVNPLQAASALAALYDAVDAINRDPSLRLSPAAASASALASLDDTAGRVEREEGSVRRSPLADDSTFTGSTTDTAHHSRRRVALVEGQVLDFEGLLERSYSDPSAPPDATRPILEDGMHYGCQWNAALSTSASKGAQMDMMTAAGYAPTMVKGTHHVNTLFVKKGASSDGWYAAPHDAVQGARPVKLKRHNWDQRHVPGPSHCGLVCSGGVLKALGSMLLTLVLSDGPGDGPTGAAGGGGGSGGGAGTAGPSDVSLVPSALTASTYVVDKCQPEYGAVPCPLYPLPPPALRAALPRSASASGEKAGDAADGAGSTLWESPAATDPLTRVWQQARLAASTALLREDDLPAALALAQEALAAAREQEQAVRAEGHLAKGGEQGPGDVADTREGGPEEEKEEDGAAADTWSVIADSGAAALFLPLPPEAARLAWDPAGRSKAASAAQRAAQEEAARSKKKAAVVDAARESLRRAAKGGDASAVSQALGKQGRPQQAAPQQEQPSKAEPAGGDGNATAAYAANKLASKLATLSARRAKWQAKRSEREVPGGHPDLGEQEGARERLMRRRRLFSSDVRVGAAEGAAGGAARVDDEAEAERALLAWAFGFWARELRAGGLMQCRQKAGVSQRAKVLDAGWCAAALDGPGGHRLAAAATAAPLEGSQGRTRSGGVGVGGGGVGGGGGSVGGTGDGVDDLVSVLADVALARPFGHWCSLPERGRFVPVL